jgi:Uma2 family endonuclease
MSSATLIPVSEYLESSYDPDCDYVDGEVRERNLGEREHAALQAIILKVLLLNSEAWEVFAFPELRVQVSQSRYRVPDICVLWKTDRRDRIVRHPPLICIEILSSKDGFRALREKIDDYIGMGVNHVWTFDPWDCKGYICTSTGIFEPESGELVVPATRVRFSLAEIFAELKKML